MNLSKSRFVAGVQCLKRLSWLDKGIRRGHQTAIAGLRSLSKDLGTNSLSIEYPHLGGEEGKIEGDDHVRPI
jgi:hypothetical protein